MTRDGPDELQTATDFEDVGRGILRQLTGPRSDQPDSGHPFGTHGVRSRGYGGRPAPQLIFARSQSMHRSLVLIPTLAAITLAGCASLNKKETGAIIGATAGAATGAMVGRANGSTAKGAIIGAAVGGAA